MQPEASRKRKPREPEVPPTFAQRLRYFSSLQPLPTSKYSPVAHATKTLVLFCLM